MKKKKGRQEKKGGMPHTHRHREGAPCVSSNYPVSWAGLRPWRSTTGSNTIRHLQKAWRRMSTNRASALSWTGSSIHHCFLCFSLSLSLSVFVTISFYMLNDQQATLVFFVCFSLSLSSASLTFLSLLICLFVCVASPSLC
jgi:hypothetical protein